MTRPTFAPLTDTDGNTIRGPRLAPTIARIAAAVVVLAGLAGVGLALVG